MDLGDRAEHRNLEQSRVKYGETGLSHPGDRLQFANPRLDGFNVFFFFKEVFAYFPVWGWDNCSRASRAFEVQTGVNVL